jgi:hypothetical protein
MGEMALKPKFVRGAETQSRAADRAILNPATSLVVRMRKSSTPPTNHPWRGFRFGKHRYERGRPIESQP